MRALALVPLFIATAAIASDDGSQSLNFLACPQIHDTTPNCWTARYHGETYYIGAQRGPDESYLPQMKHQVLVEGEVTDAPRVCGGLVMQPLRVSVMPEIDLKCDGPVLSGAGLSPPRVASRKRSGARPPAADSDIGSFMRAEVPQPPYVMREYRIDFNFGTDTLIDQMQKRMIAILTFAKAAQARTIVISGYSATTLLSNGRRLAEPKGLARQRTEKVASILVNLGLPESAMRLQWADSPEQLNGKPDAGGRRVSVLVKP